MDMAEMVDQSIEQKLQAMKDRFREGLAERLKDLEVSWQGACDGDIEAQEDLHRQAHSLAGSGATFGFEDISEAARAVERAVQAVGSAVDIATSGAVAARLAELQTLMSNVGEQRRAEPEVVKLVSERRDDVDRKLIYLVDDDRSLVENLAMQIGHFGYDVRSFVRLEELAAAVEAEVPTAIMSDVMFPEGKLAGIEAIEKIQNQLNEKVPVCFISTRDDIEARLKSVRAGGMAYFTKPVDVSGIIDRLDALVTNERPEPYRVLAVDDEEEMTDYFRLILENAGMEVAVVNDPKQVLVAMIDFLPELVLMDIYMPECSGLELAQMIRQQEAFVSLPIVYLSSEADKDRQLKAMSIGGDDFLTKPIDPEHFVGAVANRVERARVLRSYMVRDSLTGLLNHTKTKEQLDVEIARSVRQDSGLVFAIIDIDRFKSVNDTYGHPTGDRVIKSLSRLLQQRLRKVDIVGRIGGEEFGVILVDTDGNDALNVLNELREHYAKIIHQSGGVEFSSSFSCGAAQFSDYDSAQAMTEAADRALYAAKEGGRNQVVLAQPEKK
jgi:diguanylate cyclase (GGDEF)-like protein